MSKCDLKSALTIWSEQISLKQYKSNGFLLFHIIFKMILFVYFFAAVIAIPQDDLYQKLKNYQNLTVISNEEFNSLWSKRHISGNITH